MIGIITVIGGGLIRSVLAGRATPLPYPAIYALPLSSNCTAFADGRMDFLTL
jgi:uncharacterized membrane protein YeiH